MLAFELEFMDGEKRIAYGRTYSQAIVCAAMGRIVSENAECHKQLHVVSGERRLDLDEKGG